MEQIEYTWGFWSVREQNALCVKLWAYFTDVVQNAMHCIRLDTRSKLAYNMTNKNNLCCLPDDLSWFTHIFSFFCTDEIQGPTKNISSLSTLNKSLSLWWIHQNQKLKITANMVTLISPLPIKVCCFQW